MKPKSNAKNMPHRTRTEKSKAGPKSWFIRLIRHLARTRSGSILGHKTHK